MQGSRLPPALHAGLERGDTLICASAQRQAALKAAWAEAQKQAGRELWETPRILTFGQFVERSLNEAWAAAGLPDQLLPPGAEWAVLREWRREQGGTAEARALLNALRLLDDWGMPHTAAVLGGSPEGDLLLQAMDKLRPLSQRGRRPLRQWLGDVTVATPPLAAGIAGLPSAARAALGAWRAEILEPAPSIAPPSIITAEHDDHELALIAAWCREQLDQDPTRRLLIVDARLRQRRGLYDRVLAQTLSPSQWLAPAPRAQSTIFAIEGGRSLADFPLIAHALLSLRLLTSRLRFDEVLYWLRLPFLDGADRMVGVAVEQWLRQGRKLEFSAEELAQELERAPATAEFATTLARLRQAAATLAGGRRTAAEWSPLLLRALRQLGWHGARPLRSDEQQTVARWHALLDEYAAMGCWLPRGSASDAVATLADLASERNFDPASVAAPITLTESHDDPVVRYDAIWVAGLDAGQWPPAPRPDAFIPLSLQVNAGIPAASAQGQTAAAKRNLQGWRAATSNLTLSWARLEGDAHRTLSPLLLRLDAREPAASRSVPSLAQKLRRPWLQTLEDAQGIAVDTRDTVPGGVQPLTLQAECGFHAYGQMRLAAEELLTPTPGLNARERGMLLHKVLELVWIKLKDHLHLCESRGLRGGLIADSVEAAVVSVFKGRVPAELHLAVEREKRRLERLVEALLQLEETRSNFTVVAHEAPREVMLGGGRFKLRIDRIDDIEGGGCAILDYKSGEPRAPRWRGEEVRDPQLLSYLRAESGRNVQVLANVALSSGRALFVGKGARKDLLPGVKGVAGVDYKTASPEEIEAAWQGECARWLSSLERIAADYLRGHAPAQPAAEVCRHCHLTVLCRRVELAAVDVDEETT